MKSHPVHHFARDTLLELGRTGTAIEYVMVDRDGLALRGQTGGDVRILQTSHGKTRLFRNLDAVARTLIWRGLKNAQLGLGLGPWGRRSRARP